MRVLSSKYTNALRFGELPLIIVLFGVAVAIVARMPDVSALAKCLVTVLWVWASIYYWRLACVLATVKLGGDMLVVTLGDTSVFVPLRNIASVKQLMYTRVLGAVISIELDEQTALGTNIKFHPPTRWTTEWGLCYLGRVHPMVDELQALARLARYR